MQITQKEVEIYRDVYYEHVKPLLRKGIAPDIIAVLIEPVLNEYGWTIGKFHEFFWLDFTQRIVYWQEVRELSLQKVGELKLLDLEGNELDLSGAYKLPELRCPIRSEERRNLN